MRLEPSPGHWGVYNIDEFMIHWRGSIRLTFGDPKRERGAHHRSQILDTARTGLSVSMLSVDEMHTVHLGLLQGYFSTAL